MIDVLVDFAVEQAKVLVSGTVVLTLAWLRGKLAAPHVASAAEEAVCETERWAAHQVRHGRPKPSSSDKRRHAMARAKATLAPKHRVLMPLGRAIERAHKTTRGGSVPPSN